MFPQSESERRIAGMRERLIEQGLDAALFVYPVDVYYFSATRQNAVLWLPAEGDPLLLARKSVSRARAECMVADVRPFPPSRDLPSVLGGGTRKKVGLTFDVLPVQHYQFYSGLFKLWEFADISGLNRELRSVKSAWEIERMRDSGRRMSEVFAQIPSFFRPGMRELDLAAEFEARLKAAGSEGRFRMRAFNQDIVGLAVSGEAAAETGCFDGPVTGRGITRTTPFGPSFDTIREGVPIMVDYAGIFDGYLVDMSRFFVIGSLPDDLIRAFDVSREIQAWLVGHLRPGIICEDLYEDAVRMAAKAGLGGYFMGHSGEQAKFVGHGVGLELDELPVLAKGFKAPLQAGQTLAIEPKFVFPGRGAIGIENTFAITGGGCERLTTLPDDIVRL